MRSLADFNDEDLGLYFRGTFCMNTRTNKPVYIDYCGSDGEDGGYDEDEQPEYNQVVRDSDGNTLNPNDLRQWWPPTRGITVQFGGGGFVGVYISRHAQRNSRRSVCPDMIVAQDVTRRSDMMFDQVLAEELANPVHTCEATVDAIEAFQVSRADIRSFVIGPRLFFEPSNEDHMIGKLYHAGQGYAGVVDWKGGSFEGLSNKLSRVRRVRTICESIWRNSNA